MLPCSFTQLIQAEKLTTDVGQVLHVSPETDAVVVYFSGSYQRSLWAHAHAREIVKQVFRRR